MFARIVLLTMVVFGIAALWLTYRPSPAEIALAQEDDADLIATVEALQTQVAEQDERIANLEEDVALLLAGDSSPGSATPQSAESQDAAPETQTITGSINILSNGEPNPIDNNFIWPVFGADECYGQNGFDDLKGGMGVVILDGAGTVIATGQAEPGTHDEAAQICSFAFTIEDVPTSEFYAIRVGRRDGPTFSFEELEATGWKINLSIG